jgi:hypothetical protein
MTNHTSIASAPNATASSLATASIAPSPDALEEAYDEGAFFAETDWQWVMKDDEQDRPSSMAEHRATAWAFISGTVCPEWNNADTRNAFYVGYEDRATELADAGEAGYETLAESGTVADTAGWQGNVGDWTDIADQAEKAARAAEAARTGATAWASLAHVSGNRVDKWRAEEALIRARCSEI